jgi:hypothetical protein
VTVVAALLENVLLYDVSGFRLFFKEYRMGQYMQRGERRSGSGASLHTAAFFSCLKEKMR